MHPGPHVRPAVPVHEMVLAEIDRDLVDISGREEGTSFCENGCPASQLVLQPYQQAQARLITVAGGFRLASGEARRMSASVGSLVATVPEVLAGLCGSIGDKVRRYLPDSDLVRRIRNSIRDLRDVLGVSEEAMANIMPESWRDRACRGGGQEASRRSVAEVSVAGTRGRSYQLQQSAA